MAEMAVFQCGLATSNDVYGLQFTASPRGLILNKFRIYNRWHIRWIIPYQLPGWMKNSPYYGATAGIQTSDLLHSVTMSKKVPHCYPLGYRGELFASLI